MNHSMKVFKLQFEFELKKYALGQRIREDWNSVTDNIVNSDCLDIFTGRLDNPCSTEWFRISTD